MTYHHGLYGANVESDLKSRRPLNPSDPYGVRTGNADRGLSTPASSQPNSSSSQGNSLPSGAAGYAGPKFRDLRELEQHTVDKNRKRTTGNVQLGTAEQSKMTQERVAEAESLKLLKLNLRERHPILTAAQDYLYRHVLIPKFVLAFVVQLLFIVTVLITWTFLAYLIDVFFVHCHLHAERGLFTDLKSVFSWSKIANWRLVLGCILLAVASTWRYLRSMRIPPPVFHSQMQKLWEFRRVATLSGPWVLVGVSFLCLRPNFMPALEKVEVSDGNATNITEHDLMMNVEQSTSFVSGVIFWEVVLKVAAPLIFATMVILSTNLFVFWKGDFFVGHLRGSFGSPFVILQCLKNPIASFTELSIEIGKLYKDGIEPAFALPGQTFVIVLAVLFFTPILFPWASVFRIWIYYHFFCFAILHIWKYNLETMKSAIMRPYNFGKMDFVDVVALPGVITELRRTGWFWSEYFEMQLRADIQRRLRQTPNALQEYLNVRMTTRDLSQLNAFVNFWLQPLKDYAQRISKNTSLREAENDRWGRCMDLLLWAASRLLAIFQLYNPTLEEIFYEYYDGSIFAGIVAPSLLSTDSVRIVSQLLFRGREVDTRNILAYYYSPAIEQFALLRMLLEGVDQKFQEMGIRETFELFPNAEPTVKFFLKSHRQFQTVLALHLNELLKSVNDSSIELRLSDPAVRFYLDKLSRASEERQM